MAWKPITKELIDNGHCEVHFLLHIFDLLSLHMAEITQKLSGDLTLIPFLMVSPSQPKYSAKVSYHIGYQFQNVNY